MNHIAKTMYCAWMLQASYLDLTRILPFDKAVFVGSLTNSDYAPDKTFPRAQADDFTEHFDFIHHAPNNAAGFTARSFEHGTAGEIVISYTGTNPQPDMPDYIADINLGLGGR